jgi:hypothetical protein
MQEDSTMRLSAVGIIITLVLGVLVAPLAVQAQQATTKDQLIGTWKVARSKPPAAIRSAIPSGSRWRVM